MADAKEEEQKEEEDMLTDHSSEEEMKIHKRPKDDQSDEETVELDTQEIDALLGTIKNCGYYTRTGIKMWIMKHPKEYETNKKTMFSLQFNKDEAQPLYFWQLYSLLGASRIRKIVHFFYTAIFEDENEKTQWFKKAFTRIGNLHHHIRTQSAFWMDAFGAQRAYHGGEFRLDYHHRYNAAEVMNEEGAKLWLLYMVNTLNSDKVDLTKDKRVRPAINEFIRLVMNKYGHDFYFDTKQLKYD